MTNQSKNEHHANMLSFFVNIDLFVNILIKVI